MTSPYVQPKGPQKYVVSAYGEDLRLTEARAWVQKSRAPVPLYLGDSSTREDSLQALDELSQQGAHLSLVEDLGPDEDTAHLYLVPEPGRDKDVLLARFELYPDSVDEVAPHVFKLWWD